LSRSQDLPVLPVHSETQNEIFSGVAHTATLTL
jgi:hypothetical protein